MSRIYFVQLFILLIISFNGFSKSIIKEPLKYNLKYFYDRDAEYTINDILKETFKDIEKYPFNNGLKNGTYWFMLTVDNLDNKTLSTVMEIREPYIKESELYIYENDSASILYKTGNNYSLGTKPIPTRNIAYPVKMKPGTGTYYLKACFHRNVSFIFQIHKTQDYFMKELKMFAIIGMYYGISFLCICINIFCFYSFKEYVYIYYACSVFFLSIILMHLDGLMVFFLNPGWLLDNLDIVSYCIFTIVAGKFVSDFLEIRTYFPKSGKIEKTLHIITLTIFILFIISENVLLFAFGITAMLVYFFYYWIISFLLIKKQKFAKFITMGYVLLMFIAAGFAIPILYGYDLLKEESGFIKFGGLVGMLFFLYSLVYRTKVLKLEHENMYKKIQDFFRQIDDGKSDVKFVFGKHKYEISEPDLNLLKNKFNLTSREIDVIQYIMKDFTNAEIGDHLCVSVNTVKYHIRNIYLKLDVSGRKEVLKKLANTEQPDTNVLFS